MLEDGGKPVVGNKRDMLGVRENGCDITIDPDDVVRPNTGGLSIAPEWRTLPPFLIPRRLAPTKVAAARGNARLAIFRLGSAAFADAELGHSLRLRVTSSVHGSIEPAQLTTLAKYQAELAATRDDWLIDES